MRQKLELERRGCRGGGPLGKRHTDMTNLKDRISQYLANLDLPPEDVPAHDDGRGWHVLRHDAEGDEEVLDLLEGLREALSMQAATYQRHTIKVTVITDHRPLNFGDLGELQSLREAGEVVLDFEVSRTETLTREEAADALEGLGSLSNPEDIVAVYRD